MATIKRETGGIYQGSLREFERNLKKAFRKRKDLFVPSRIRKALGTHPYQIEKYLPELERRGKVRRVTAYFLGCPPTELIVEDFGFGEVAICPTCHTQLPWPPAGNRVACRCGVRYVKRAQSRWTYEPRVRYLGGGKWRLESFSKPGTFYTVSTFERKCSCPHHQYRGAYCKHMKKTADLVANLIFNETMNISVAPPEESLAVITAAIRRWLDPREHMRTATYRELRNDMEKISGLKLTTHRIARIISKFEEKGVLKRTQDPGQGVGRKTLITTNQWALHLFLKLAEEKISNTLHGEVAAEPYKNQKPFLKLNKVVHPIVALPYTEFTVEAHVNYRFLKPTAIRLDALVDKSRKVLGSITALLSGEDVASFSLKLAPPREKVWGLRLELYQRNEKIEWHPVDHYLSSRQIHTPTIEIQRGGVWRVESFSQQGKFYEVDVSRNWCSCPDHTYNLNHCKHLQAVEKIIQTIPEYLTKREPFIAKENQCLKTSTGMA